MQNVKNLFVDWKLKVDSFPSVSQFSVHWNQKNVRGNLSHLMYIEALPQ